MSAKENTRQEKCGERGELKIKRERERERAQESAVSQRLISKVICNRFLLQFFYAKFQQYFSKNEFKFVEKINKDKEINTDKIKIVLQL